MQTFCVFLKNGASAQGAVFLHMNLVIVLPKLEVDKYLTWRFYLWRSLQCNVTNTVHLVNRTYSRWYWFPKSSEQKTELNATKAGFCG